MADSGRAATRTGSDKPAPAVHAVGPLATGVVAFALLVLGEALGVPLTTALGVAGLVMTASLLTQLEPIDGAYLPRARPPPSPSSPCSASPCSS